MWFCNIDYYEGTIAMKTTIQRKTRHAVIDVTATCCQ